MVKKVETWPEKKQQAKKQQTEVESKRLKKDPAPPKAKTKEAGVLYTYLPGQLPTLYSGAANFSIKQLPGLNREGGWAGEE